MPMDEIKMAVGHEAWRVDMPVKKRPLTQAEERQLKMIRKALGNHGNHPLVDKILVDHHDRLPRVGNCGVTLEESANYEEYPGRAKR